MRLFKCQCCEQLLYFENHQCERCGHRLGYEPSRLTMLALEADGDDWREAGITNGPRYRVCANADPVYCNWLVPADSETPYCVACRHNRTVPDLNFPENIPPWRALEAAKRRLFYALMRLNLPLRTRSEDPVHGLAFDFLAESAAKPHVLTGHEDGLITIALKEGDEAERERTRIQMGELYRTPLGHFRHEIGHHFWDLLVRDGGQLDGFRELFGDERADYASALQAHYNRQDDGSWRHNFVSLYASSHPWEDFAETWAHFLHILDTMEMAGAFGIAIHPRLARDPGLQADIDFDPYVTAEMSDILEGWLPLTYAVNSLNRTMGQPDLYPFVLTPSVVRKLAFIHCLVRRGGGEGRSPGRSPGRSQDGQAGTTAQEEPMDDAATTLSPSEGPALVD